MKLCALMRQTWFESAQKHLTDLERLAFYEACFIYEFTGEIPSDKTCKYGSVLLMFDMVKNDLQADREKAEKIAERARENGRYGGRPRKDNNTLQEKKTQSVNEETQQNQGGYFSSSLHNTTQHNTTMQQAANSGSGIFDVSFFDSKIWPRLNRSGKFNTRHRVCVQKWSEYSERKRQAITKAVLSDVFAGADNPFFYLEDFKEPEPKYLTGIECEREWQAGHNVYMIRVGGAIKYVTAEDVQAFQLTPEKEMPPVN